MTIEQILTEIYRSGCADEVFLALSKRVISEKEKLNKQIAENNATLRLIGKITKDKTVKEIFEE
jgi:hypothetical protein